jgi:hypothetical protein
VLRDGRHGPTSSRTTSVLEQQRTEVEQMRAVLAA